MHNTDKIVAKAALLLIISGGGFLAYGTGRFPVTPQQRRVLLEDADSVTKASDNYFVFDGDTLFSAFIPVIKQPHSGPLTDADFRAVADSLGVEVAAIKAVVDIETGRNHTGFHRDGRPLVNFDLGLFKRRAASRGVSLTRARSTHPETFAPLNITRYGSQQAAHYARLDGAMAIDSIAAIEATFWGMFQIGGFNWKLAGATSHQDFVARMSRSEYDQLILFANFIRNTGLLKYLRSKNWSAFARFYNGPGYASHGYHTRLAAAYARHRQSG